MRVAVVGSGLIGGRLGTLFGRAGHQVVFSYSRSEQKLKRLARDAGRNAQTGTPAEAAQDANAVLIAVHWSRVNDVLAQIGDLSGKVLITCMLPMDEGNTALVVANTSSGAEELARLVPRARVVSAFNTVPSEVLFRVFEGKRSGRRPSLVFCSDDSQARKLATKLIRDMGFEPIDGGPLRTARYTEPMGLLVAQLAYNSGRSARLVYRFEWLRSKRSKSGQK
jgi:8-hydroxy-5-deazaflavin:NADPH oxidoreductase